MVVISVASLEKANGPAKKRKKKDSSKVPRPPLQSMDCILQGIIVITVIGIDICATVRILILIHFSVILA